jgi:hypothetical protein
LIKITYLYKNYSISHDNKDMANESKSILKEALVDYNSIQEAADANAKKRLAEEFPKEFNNLLKEEITKNKKSVKESYKILDNDKESEESDETESNKESDMKNQEKETKKVVKEEAGSSKPFGEKPKGIQKVAEDVKITDTVGKGEPFKEKAKAKGKDMLEEEREKDFVADVEAKTPNQGKGELEKGVAFKEKIKGPTSGKPMPNLTEEFDITELDTQSVDNALGNAGGNDDVLTMEQIEEEISQMQGLGEELNGVQAATTTGSPVDQLVKMREQLDEMINNLGGLGEQKNNGGQGANQVNAGGPTHPMIDELGEQKNNGGQGANRIHPGGPTQPMIDEEPTITDQDVQDVLGSAGSEAPVDETMQISYSAGTITPGKLGDHEGTHGRFRQQDESAKKLGGLIKENKILTKKLNETKEYKQSVTKLLENYKIALDKYRNQLKEMAVFNTNLAHVNNLLVNEELALTQDDKIKIINEFKKVDSIASSQKVYKNFLTEMKEGKKTLTESVEAKASVSIQPSSKQQLDEVTAYKDDKHINKMKKLIEYVERRDKKIIQ